jgi:type I restriction enzyme, S subunit
MSEVPTNWAIAAGNDLFSLVRGVSYDKAHASDLPGDDLVPILRANNISDAQIITDDLVYVPTRYVSPDQFLYDGDLLIAASSGSRTVVGKAARASEMHQRFAFGAFCTVARSRMNEHSSWLSCYMKTRAYREYVERVALGININNLRGSDLAAMPIKIAPLPEQRRIVAKIDSLSAKSNRARDQLDHIPRLVEKYKQAILAAAFQGELTADWRAAHSLPENGATLKARLLHERDERRREEGVGGKGANRSIPSDVLDLPTLPSSWAWMTFDECSWDLTVGHVGPMKHQYVSDGVPFLRSMNVKPNAIDMGELTYITEEFDGQLTKSRLSQGTIVVVRTGEPGVAAVVPQELHGANCSDLVICRPIRSLQPSFGAHYINSEFAKRIVRGFQVGVAQQHFNIGAMEQASHSDAALC